MNNYQFPILKQLEENLVLIKHQIIGDTIQVLCELKNVDHIPVHSRRIRVIKDIPYGSYKTELHIMSKFYFKEDKAGTYVETIPFIGMTKRIKNR